jgi:hypothetical protein
LRWVTSRKKSSSPPSGAGWARFSNQRPHSGRWLSNTSDTRVVITRCSSVHVGPATGSPPSGNASRGVRPTSVAGARPRRAAAAAFTYV